MGQVSLGLASDFEWRLERDLGRLHCEALRLNEQRAITYEMGRTNGFVDLPTTTGITVSPYTAYQVSAWWCGISVISGDVGVLDRHLYRRVGNDDRERAVGHPIDRVLNERPNEYMVPIEFWQTIMAHVLGWGNGYAEIEWDNAMRPIALWPILPTDIEPVCTVVIGNNGRRKSEIWYRYLGQYRVEAEDIVHIRGLSFDGLKGYSVVTLARQSLGLSIAAERFGGSFFGNMAMPGIVLEHPAQLTKDAQDRIRASVNGMHQGVERAFRMFIAEEGMKVGRQIAVNPNDAQAVETREHQIIEVARWLNLSPHKLKHKMGERPGGNLETSEIDHHVTTLLPWTTKIDQTLNQKLVSPSQRSTHYVEHNYQRRLQATAIQRMTVQSGYQKMGVLDAEQIARQENLPKPKPKKVEPVAPPPSDAPPPPPAKDPEGAADARAAAAQRVLFLDVAGRYVRRESAAAARAAKKGPEAFQAWAEDFYASEAAVLGECLTPAVGVALAISGLDGDARAIARGYAEGYMARSKGELLAMPAKDLGPAVARLMERWETTRTVEMADQLAALVAAMEKHDAA